MSWLFIELDFSQIYMQERKKSGGKFNILGAESPVNKMDFAQNGLPLKVTTFVRGLILCLYLLQTEKSRFKTTLGSFILGYVCQVSSNADAEFIAVPSTTDSPPPPNPGV